MDLVVKHSLNISSNMEELADNIKKDIQNKYDLIVTEDSLPETKKLMAEINKGKDDFKKKYKEFKNEVLAPLVPLDAKAKEIEGYFDDARSALDNQVKNFEKGKLEAIKVIVEKYRDDACLNANIIPESITITDLVILSAVNVNSKGYSIAKKTSDTIDQRIQAVENQILKARLEAEEKAKEVERIKEEARKEAEANAQREKEELIKNHERELAEVQKPVIEPVQQPIVQEAPKEPTFTDDGKKVYSISFVFEASANPSVSVDKVIDKVKSMMLTETGLEKLKKIEVL